MGRGHGTKGDPGGHEWVRDLRLEPADVDVERLRQRAVGRIARGQHGPSVRWRPLRLAELAQHLHRPGRGRRVGHRHGVVVVWHPAALDQHGVAGPCTVVFDDQRRQDVEARSAVRTASSQQHFVLGVEGATRDDAAVGRERARGLHGPLAHRPVRGLARDRGQRFVQFHRRFGRPRHDDGVAFTHRRQAPQLPEPEVHERHHQHQGQQVPGDPARAKQHAHGPLRRPRERLRRRPLLALGGHQNRMRSRAIVRNSSAR